LLTTRASAAVCNRGSAEDQRPHSKKFKIKVLQARQVSALPLVDASCVAVIGPFLVLLTNTLARARRNPARAANQRNRRQDCAPGLSAALSWLKTLFPTHFIFAIFRKSLTSHTSNIIWSHHGGLPQVVYNPAGESLTGYLVGTGTYHYTIKSETVCMCLAVD
jgi:hypothetical protein